MSSGWLGPFGVPSDPEIVQKMEEHRQRQKMEHEAAHQELYEFLTELPPERMRILCDMLRSIIHMGDDGHVVAAEYFGMCQSILVVKHNRCPGCGEDHSEEFLESISAEQPEGEE